MPAVVRRIRFLAALMAVPGLAGLAHADSPSTTPAAATDQVIVFLRHAEKPERGLGQLTCQGLNRALALPAVLERKFGKPTAIFAASAGIKTDSGVPYNYVRPLATIEPTAIRAGLPVNAGIAFTDAAGLEAALLAPALHSGTTLVAWEHHLARTTVQNMLAHLGGNADAVPRRWPDDDFDSLYVVRLRWAGGQASEVRFERMAEGLDGQPTACRN